MVEKWEGKLGQNLSTVLSGFKRKGRGVKGKREGRKKINFRSSFPGNFFGIQLALSLMPCSWLVFSLNQRSGQQGPLVFMSLCFP